MMAIIIKTAVHSPRRAHPINKRLSGSQFGYPQRFQIHATRAPQAVARAVAHSCVGCIVVAAHKLWPALLSLLILRMFQRLEFLGSDFGNPHRFQTPATRMPQAVARAVAHSCVDVSPLLLKLRRPLLLFVILRLFQKLSFSGSNARNPQRFQISVTRMPQAVARAVARSCVDASRLQPKLLRTLLSILCLQMLKKTLISRFRFWEPEENPNPCHAHASRSCARGCAQLRGCIPLLPKVRPPLLSVVICKCFQTLLFSCSDLGNPQRAPSPSHAHAPSSCARGWA